jgi:polyisoprenoid-binding protein YceI
MSNPYQLIWSTVEKPGGFVEMFRTKLATKRIGLSALKIATVCVLGFAVLPSMGRAQESGAVPIYQITPLNSTVKFDVKASVPIVGTFDKWDATLVFTSTDLATGVLDIEIQAASVNTGSGLKNSKLKGKDFFNVDHDPVITFKSTKILQTGSNTFEVDGNFSIRGVSKPEKLELTLTGRGTGNMQITGSMAFDRKEYGMNSGIPFIKIADRVEVNVALKVKRTSGPPVTLKS